MTIRSKVWGWACAVAMAAALGGCAVSQKVTVKPEQAPLALQSANEGDLIASYNSQANAIHSLNASVTMRFTAGSAYSGVIEQYHEISGFILAQKPEDIRVIGQAPIVGKNIFDMESDGETFHIFVPSKNQFLVGASHLERPSTKPIENLRPQHLLDAMFWQPIPGNVPVLLDEAQENQASYYVLIVARRTAEGPGNEQGNSGWEMARKIWIDRKDLNVTRIQIREAGGKVSSDIKYTNWDMFGGVKYARGISLSRPGNDYQLQIGVTKLTANEPISAERFELKQPEGSQFVQVGEEHTETKP